MKNLKYILMVLLGGTMYGTMSSFVKMSYSRGYHASELSFWQAFLAAVILGVCTYFTRGKTNRGMKTKDIVPLILTGCAIGLTNFLYYESVSYIPASLAIILLMQFTWFSILLEWVIFTRKPSRLELVTVTFILIGTVMAGRLFEMETFVFSMKGVILALCSSLTYAVYIVANGRVGKGVRWQSKSMMIMAGSSLCIFSINADIIVSFHEFDHEFMLWAMFLAVIGTTIPTALFAAGISKIGAAISSILMTVELPVAILCARVVLGERISTIQMAGVIIMLSSICAMNYYRNRKLHK